MESSEPLPEAKALPDAPTDGITALEYLGNKSLLASTSWDGVLRVHDTLAQKLELSQAAEIPLLSLARHGEKLLFTGGIDGCVRKFDIETSTTTTVGRHETASRTDSLGCSCLASLGDNEPLVASAGWHRKLHLWDTRQQAPAATVDLPGKAFSMDVTNDRNLLAIGTSDRRTCFVDVRSGTDTANLVLDRESSLKYQTRCVRFFPDGNAIAVSSIEGRAAVEFLHELGRGEEKKKFAFKCHRVGDSVHPVNTIAFHPILGTFATGGCDGTVGTLLFFFLLLADIAFNVRPCQSLNCFLVSNEKFSSPRSSTVIWDGYNKKKLTSLPALPTSIAALAFNHDGTELAIASSYTFEEGEREHPKDEIYIRQMLESECMPKKKS